jgi:uncharacterized DUF497 family protein
MEFDWIDADLKRLKVPPKDIEESFEDPFALKLLPDDRAEDAAARYYGLGKSLNGLGVFSVFWTDGKKFRVICARPMSEIEGDFYERKKAEEV